MLSPKCVRIDDRDESSATALQGEGWRFVERLLSMECRTFPVPKPDAIRYATEFDLVRLVQIARANMGPNRFIRDGLLDETFAADVREKWVREKLDHVLVYDDGNIRGFLLEGGEILELVVVDSIHRRRGVGRALTMAFISQAWRNGHTFVRLGTQIDNEPAISMYRSLGFVTTGCRRTFHK